jgi:hypothetical protein
MDEPNFDKWGAEMNSNGEGLSEDWLSLIIGLVIFVLALGLLGGVDLLGWVVTTGVWTDLNKALAPISKAYAGLGGVGALVATYVGLLALMTAGAAALRADVGRFVLAFTAVFWISYICWIVGSYANVAVNTPADMQKFGISWSLRLTAEGGFVIALIVGVVVGNLLPGVAGWNAGGNSTGIVHQDRHRPSWGLPRDSLGREAELGDLSHVSWLGIDHRLLSDILGSRVLRGARLVQIQPRMGGPIGIGHFRLRRVRGDRHRQRHPRAPGRGDHGFVVGGGLCGGRAAHSAVCSGLFPRPATDGSGRVDGAVG